MHRLVVVTVRPVLRARTWYQDEMQQRIEEKIFQKTGGEIPRPLLDVAISGKTCPQRGSFLFCFPLCLLLSPPFERRPLSKLRSQLSPRKMLLDKTARGRMGEKPRRERPPTGIRRNQGANPITSSSHSLPAKERQNMRSENAISFAFARSREKEGRDDDSTFAPPHSPSPSPKEEIGFTLKVTGKKGGGGGKEKGLSSDLGEGPPLRWWEKENGA